MVRYQQNMKSINQKFKQSPAKQRFGLFSYPADISLSPPPNNKSKIIQRDQYGKPVTKPKNIITSASKSGRLSSSYFTNPSSIYIGDPYPLSSRSISKSQPKYFKQIHESVFRPSSGSKTLSTAAYKYIQQIQYPKTTRSIIRDENGRVKTEPKNITTNPCTKIQSELMKYPSSHSLFIQRTRKIQKINNNEEPFKPNFKGNQLFSKLREVYGSDSQIREQIETKKQVNHTKHEQDFLPTRAIGGYFNNYPKYMSRQQRLIAKIPISNIQRQIFKPSRGNLSIPSPTTDLNKLNLIKYKNRLKEEGF